MAEIPDYSLGRAHGKIEISYDGDGADKAARDIHRVAAESDKMDASLSKSQRTLKDTEKEFDRAGTSAEHYSKRIHDVDDAHTHLHTSHQSTNRDLDEFSTGAGRAGDSAGGLSRGLHVAADAMAVFGGEFDGASEGLEALSKGFSHVSAGADAGSQHVRDFVRHIADFEKSFAKVSGMTLALPSLAGLGGLAGGAGVQGITAMLDSVRQLSGALGLLPAAIAGVGFSMGTLKVAFHGVGDALKDMMSDDPKKFLEDIKNMGPVAAQSMLQVAQFRNQFKMAGGAIQDSFFKQIIGDIQPLIQTWLPAVAGGMSKIAGVFGQAAHQFAGLLQQPAMMQAFQTFIGNLAAGLQSLQPAMVPLLDIFTRLTTVGSGFFAQIGQRITQMLGFFDQIVTKAQASGSLQTWIQSGIDAFSRLVNIAYLVGSAFNTIFETAEKFGGGGFLGWLQQVTGQFNTWTKSAAGQNTLQQFFATTQQAMQSFAPMITPIAQGIGSLLTAFTRLGIGIAPGWQTFFNTFAQTMQQMGPVITGLAPTLNQFLTGLSGSFAQLMASVGPQLPAIFAALSNAFLALIPQVQPLVNVFLELVQQVGPQLPKFFGDVTSLIQSMMPFLPILTGFVRDFVSVLTWFIGAGAGVIGWFTNFLGAVNNLVAGIPGVFGKIEDAIKGVFTKLPSEAEQWGKDLMNGFINGMKSLVGNVDDFLKRNITDHIPGVVKKALGISSPSKVFHEIGVNIMQGLQQGIGVSSGSVLDATDSIAHQVVAAASSAVNAVGAAAAGSGLAARGLGGAPAPAAGGSGTVGSALLPDNIAGADVSILRAYEQHQFDPSRGLKGLAKSLGQGLSMVQTGFNLMQQYIMQPILTGIGLMPGAKDPSWRKMTPAQQAAQLRANADTTKPTTTWGDVLGQGSPGAAPIPGMNLATGAVGAGGAANRPLGLKPDASSADIQKAIIAAGKQRGLSDAAIQAALAVAGDESGYRNLNYGDRDSLGIYQQRSSQGWGTPEQIMDPNYSINKFYDSFQQQLSKNPTDPFLAAVQTQNPGVGKGSTYYNAVQDQLGLAGSILNAPGNKGITGPTWAQLTPGAPGAPATIPGLGLATSAVPAGPTGRAAISANPASRAGTLGGASANYTPSTMAAAGIAPLFTKQGAGSMTGAPAWVQQFASAFGLTATSHADTTLHGGTGQMGDWAFDFSGGVANMQKFADFIRTNLAAQTLQAIWQNPQTGSQLGIAGGQILGPGQYYTTAGGSYADHTDHVHWATDVAPLFNGQVPPGSMLVPGAGPTPAPGTGPAPLPLQPGASGSPTGSLVLPSGKTLDQLTANTGKSADANDQLLQAYLQGNPALAGQINAAQQPGASDTVVLGALNGIGKTIDGLKQQDAVGNKQTIDALQSTQSDIASQQGYSSGQSQLATVTGALGGIGNAITGGFQIAQAVLDAMGATQDIADRMVYGVANTEDVQHLVDDVQSYITVAASIASETSNVLSAVGNIAAASGSGPSGGDPAGGIQGAASIAALVAGAIQGVNSAIDYGQQIYEIAMGYFGQFMSYLTAGPGGTPLMGNVQYMLNTNTGKLVTSSLDNPQQQNQLTVPQFLQGLYGMGAYGNNGADAASNPGVGELNIYAGPGQSPAAMMNEAMWQVHTGNVGAAVASNF